MIAITTKKCCKCKVEKPLEAFYQSTRSRDGRALECKACRADYRCTKTFRPAIVARQRYLKSLETEDTRACYKCEQIKPLEAFTKVTQGRKGCRSQCRECISKIGVQHKRERRNYRLTRTHGITLDEFESRLLQQGSRCSICGTNNPGAKGVFHVDHDHVTGKVRELLCQNCNVGLGYFTNPEHLELAAAYLRKHQ